MKKPRSDYFDPKRRRHPVGELASPLDEMPKIGAPPSLPQGSATRRAMPNKTDTERRRAVATGGAPDRSTAGSTAQRVAGSTPRRNKPVPAPRRTLTRSAFDVFDDQVAQLRRLSLEARLRGETGQRTSMSAMFRKALDDYLAKRKGKRTGV